MATVRLRGTLEKLAGGGSEHRIEGATVNELLQGLERTSSALDGWILDERGVLRRHINVFVNGEPAARTRRWTTTTASRSCRRSPGADAPMTELLVGTRKGLFVLEGGPGAEFGVTTRAFVGEPVDYAMREPRTGRLFAAVTSPFWGPRIWYADDLASEWRPATGVALPKGGDAALRRIWAIVAADDGSRLWAGGDPGGQTWSDIAEGLPSDFGFPVVLDPADPDSAYVIPVASSDRVTPGGRVLVWETRDAGASWTPHGDGLPQLNAYLSILRQSFDGTGEGAELELYFGATSGEVFGSRDAGSSWFQVICRLPAIASVRVGR